MSSARFMTGSDWAMLGLLSLVWGGSFFFGKIAVAEIPPLTLTLARVALAALALHIYLRLSGVAFPRDGRTLFAFLIMGALNNVIPFTLIFWGQTEIDSGLASILNATTPLWTALLAHVLVPGEKLTALKIGGVLMGLMGVAALVGPEALFGLGQAVAAQAAVIGATVSYALSAIYARRFRAVPPFATAAGQLTASTLLTAPLALAFDQPWTLPLPGSSTLAALIALALISTAFAYGLYFRILARAGATNAALVTFLVPISAILLGASFLGERLPLAAFGGMALIGLGLAAIDGRLPTWIVRKWRSDRIPDAGT